VFVPSKLFQASLKFSSSDKSLSLEWAVWIGSGFTNKYWKSKEREEKFDAKRSSLFRSVVSKAWRRALSLTSSKCDKIAMIHSDIFLAPQHLS
jgi:hypothetical protein